MNYYDETKPYDEIDVEDVLDTATYEVWALGYDDKEAITDAELMLNSFENPDDAVAYAEKVTLAEIVHRASQEAGVQNPDYTVSYIVVEVETVVDDEDGAMNVGTVYRKVIPIIYNERNESK